MVVTIDGPAGSGKSTTAREVAKRLGFRHLDSGSLYRALTLAIVRAGIPGARWPVLDADTLGRLDVRLEPEVSGFRVLLDGEPTGAELRSPEVTALVPRLASVAAARERLSALQRSARAFGGLVADGRDMGTVIFPDAEVKVFLTASLEERARRRLLQEGSDAQTGEVQVEADRIRERDDIDVRRSVAPLREPPGALRLDTTRMSFQGQVDRIVTAVEAYTERGGGLTKEALRE